MAIEGKFIREIRQQAGNLAIALHNAKFLYRKIVDNAQENWEKSTQAVKHQHQTVVDDARETYEKVVRAAKQQHQSTGSTARETYENLVQAANRRHQNIVDDTQITYEKLVQSANSQYQRTVEKSQADYEATRASTREYFVDLNTKQGYAALSWDHPWWNDFSPFTGYYIPEVTRLGELTSNQLTSFRVPALLPIIGHRNVLIKASKDGKQQAILAMQAITLRLLATLPGGKLKTTLIDPVGLGKNMGGLVNLPDELTGGKVWTERNHIEQQLQNLSEHMEVIIQKYLRNQFHTMEEYNRNAEEVEEPYRLLVIANFPTNFSDDAAKRLISIATNGPSTGVYVLITVDMDIKKLPHDFNLEDLERSASIIVQQSNNFIWQEPVFSEYNLELDKPPSQERFNEIVEKVGEVAKQADKVEVPFSKIAPPEKNWWRQYAGQGLQAPIGRKGARDVQHLVLGLGKETLQHVLIAGRTGSGKSTLLHTIIVSLALIYSPEELELYLLDFKRVEFSTYATHRLPHAKVVATQGDREFGLSLLDKLKNELLHRQATFQKQECKNLDGYRTKTGKKLPRILLLVDEFQQFFAEDDNLARQAMAILEDLVREGRAFGIHLMMASQSLKGTASLIKGVISEQMGVRIALQCSVEDSRLILSDDNQAARLLSRPGEAYYNDENGRVEGNERFQVVMLNDADRDEYLRKLALQAQSINYVTSQIVFEGDKPANIQANSRFQTLLNTTNWPEQSRVAYAWLGEPIAIKDHTAATFRRQSRSNMLVLGQDERTALAMLSSTFISLATQYHPDDVNFYMLDTIKDDMPWISLVEDLSDAVPHPTRVLRRRHDVEERLNEIAEIVKQRSEQEKAGKQKTIYLFIIGLHNTRDLRKEGYAYSRLGGQFINILKEGPAEAVHTIVWCDTFASLERILNRGDVEEFDLRIALQMTENDSQSFLASPLAKKLGPNRAYFSNQERMGSLEKFRPYELPDDSSGKEWLKHVSAKLNNRPK